MVRRGVPKEFAERHEVLHQLLHFDRLGWTHRRHACSPQEPPQDNYAEQAAKPCAIIEAAKEQGRSIGLVQLLGFLQLQRVVVQLQLQLLGFLQLLGHCGQRRRQKEGQEVNQPQQRRRCIRYVILTRTTAQTYVEETNKNNNNKKKPKKMLSRVTLGRPARSWEAFSAASLPRGSTRKFSPGRRPGQPRRSLGRRKTRGPRSPRSPWPASPGPWPAPR
mmetsp:Transcript_5729/g.17333  ORF Transcript_5729/g.17333 Transcript_5729/m.17333 type:complete len:219 (+) Transcript_5729:1606-2262(+)